MMLEAPGFEKLITALYPEGDEYIKSDAVFGYVVTLRCFVKSTDSRLSASRAP